ncbi:MAG: hypothetical protein L0387_24905 [Acidobacteria bacterium]|nr:hypothetical protein [Acidobacteriota bacterium]
MAGERGKQFNGLNPDEAERLFLLLEETGEIQQAIGKILRHGYESTHPDGGPTNREDFERELGDFLAILDLMVSEEDVDRKSIEHHRQEKPDKMEPYLHHTVAR